MFTKEQVTNLIDEEMSAKVDDLARKNDRENRSIKDEFTDKYELL